MPFFGFIFRRFWTESADANAEANAQNKLKKRSRLFPSDPSEPTRYTVDSTPLVTIITPPVTSRASTTAVPDLPCLPIYESFTTGKHRSMFLENWQPNTEKPGTRRRLSRIATIGDFQNLGRRTSQSLGEDIVAHPTTPDQPPAAAHDRALELGRYYRSLLPDIRTMWEDNEEEEAEAGGGGQPTDSQQHPKSGTGSSSTEPPLPLPPPPPPPVPPKETVVEGSVPRASLSELPRMPSSDAIRAGRAGSCASFASTAMESGDGTRPLTWQPSGSVSCVRVRDDEGWPLLPGTAPAAGSVVGPATSSATGRAVGLRVDPSVGPAAGPLPRSRAASTADSGDSGVAPPPTPPPKSPRRQSRAVSRRQTRQSLAGGLDGADSVSLQLCSDLLTDQLTKAVVSSDKKDSDSNTEEKRQSKKKLQVLLMIEAYEGMLQSCRQESAGAEDEAGSASEYGERNGDQGVEERKAKMGKMVPVLEHWLEALHGVYDEALAAGDSDE